MQKRLRLRGIKRPRRELCRPGSGEPKEGCGEIYRKMCLDCGSVFTGEHRCMDRMCPRCYGLWALREAEHSAIVLHLNRSARKCYHVMLSLPRDGGDALENRGKAYRIFSDHGIEAGSCIVHVDRHGRDDGFDHYHAIGFIRGRYKPGAPEMAYVFKVIRRVGGASDMQNLTNYLLTHCAIRKRSHALTYFGDMVGTKDRPERKECQCPVCGSIEVIALPLVDRTGGWENWEYLSDPVPRHPELAGGIEV